MLKHKFWQGIQQQVRKINKELHVAYAGNTKVIQYDNILLMLLFAIIVSQKSLVMSTSSFLLFLIINLELRPKLLLLYELQNCWGIIYLSIH